eukprot:jgi/Psemu1/304727/fgenesh1_kg.167_\
MLLQKQNKKSHRDCEDQKTTCSCATIKAGNLTNSSDGSAEHIHDDIPAMPKERREKKSWTIFGRLRKLIVSISRNHSFWPKSVWTHRKSQSAEDLLEEAQMTTKRATAVTPTATATTSPIATRKSEPDRILVRRCLSPAAASHIADTTIGRF